MKKKTRITWHAGFVSAMKLDLIENEDDLQYSPEYYLTGKHQRIDLLIIKNEGSAVIRNPIGAGFSRYNICEYKSPGDSLTYGEFSKSSHIQDYTLMKENDTGIIKSATIQ